MNTPIKYVESPDGDILNNSKFGQSNSYWVVCSDRDENKAYNNPDNSATPIAVVAFLDKFYVTGEKDEYLELYRYEENIRLEGAGKRNQLNPKKAKRIGWIKKENLLLWTRCLENKTTHFSEKALTVYNEKNIHKSSSLTKNNNVRIFNKPDLQKENSNTVKMFQFLYVYKRTGTSVLIGKVYRSNAFRIERDVLGWVDEDILQNWDNRVCIQPNWDDDAVSERKAAGIKASLFGEKGDAVTWREGKEQPKPIWNQDPYEQPWVGSKLRLPILSSDKDLVYTGFATNLFSENDKGIVATVDEVARMTKTTNEISRDARQINIVFVIDAGYGMKTYKSAINGSLKSLIRRREELNGEGEKRNTYKYGAVVYRSVEDKNCAGGDLSLRKSPITINGQQVINFLDEEFEKEGCSSNEVNKDAQRAMIEALQMIRNANSNATQSNFMLFLGGATGNNEPELKIIPELIAKYDVNLSIFQVLCATPVQFENFSDNFIQIIKAASTKKYQQSEKIFDFKPPKFKQVGEGTKNIYRLDHPASSPIQGTITFPEKGESISSETIDDVLDTAFNYFEKNLENMISDAKTLVTGMGEKKIDFINATVKNFLQKAGSKMNDMELASKFDGKNVQFFIPAWTTTSIHKLEKPVFKHVIYVNEEELSDMIRKFESLQIEGSSSDVRDKMYEAYQSLVITYFGKDSKVDELFKNKLTVEAVLNKITGLPSQSPFLKQVTINEIKDPGKVSDEQVDRIQKQIRLSLDNLKNVSKDFSGSMRDVRDEGVFYWIPEDYFP